MHNIKFILDRLIGCDSFSDLTDVVADIAAAYGFNHYSYIGLDNPGLPTLSGLRTLTSYPQEWRDIYVRESLARHDPVTKQAFRKGNSFTWGPETASGDAAHRLMEMAQKFSIIRGYSTPIRTLNGSIALMTFCTTEQEATMNKILDRAGLELQLMTFYIHNKMSELTNKQSVRLELTNRQEECLYWASQGKSAPEISIILGITVRTVRFHLNNGKEKLGTPELRMALTRFVTSQSVGQPVISDS